MPRTFIALRSVLYVPGSNERAMHKSTSLPADALIFDLEDAVASEAIIGASGAPDKMEIWCMMETPRGMLHAAC